MKKDRVILKAADMFDIPADIKGGLLHIETEGRRAVFLENHKGIVSISEEEIEVNSSEGSVFVSGSRLKVGAMNGDELKIEGVIEKIEFGRGGR